MNGRSRTTIDPCILTIPLRRTLGFHRWARGAYSFVACLSYLIIDHAPFSRRWGRGGGGRRSTHSATGHARVSVAIDVEHGNKEGPNKHGTQTCMTATNCYRGRRSGILFPRRAARSAVTEQQQALSYRRRKRTRHHLRRTRSSHVHPPLRCQRQIRAKYSTPKLLLLLSEYSYQAPYFTILFIHLHCCTDGRGVGLAH